MTTHPPTECCGYKCHIGMPHPVQFNPFNSVTQCHNCGHMYVPKDHKAYNEAKTLAESIQRKEFPKAKSWSVLEDTAGVISQIDNMFAGVRGQRDMLRSLLMGAKNRLESIRETDKSGLHLDDDIARLSEALK